MTPVCGLSETPHRFDTRTQIVALGCACIGASLFVFAVDPNHHAVYPQCFFHQTTGLYCAGCGATRALYAILHGRVLNALHDNLLFTLSLPVVIVVGGWYVLQAWRRNGWPPMQMKPSLALRNAGVVFALMVLFTILRNLPGMPFDLLKPLSG